MKKRFLGNKILLKMSRIYQKNYKFLKLIFMLCAECFIANVIMKKIPPISYGKLLGYNKYL